MDGKEAGASGSLNTIVLAGGKSSRLGKDKALLPLAGKPLLEWVVRGVAPFSREVILVGNRRDYLIEDTVPIRWVQDRYPDSGPLVGIYSGLEASRTDLNFAIASDMPFINSDLVQHMIEKRGGAEVVVAEVGGYIEPLHALYHRDCLPEIQRSLQAKEFRIRAFYQRVQVKVISEALVRRYDPEGLCFFNINTLEDLARARELLEQTEERFGEADEDCGTDRSWEYRPWIYGSDIP